MATPSESVRASLLRRLRAHARSRWPALAGIDLRYQVPFVYVDGRLRDGEAGRRLPLCRLRLAGSDGGWTFAVWVATDRVYEEWPLPDGRTTASPEEALDRACEIYFEDPNTWRLPPSPR